MPTQSLVKVEFNFDLEKVKAYFVYSEEEAMFYILNQACNSKYLVVPVDKQQEATNNLISYLNLYNMQSLGDITVTYI